MIPYIIPLASDTPRLHQPARLHQPVSRSPVAQRHANAFPPRPRKYQWHCTITNVISLHGLPIHYRSKHITRDRQSSRSPATRRVYTSVFRAPQWHGATQTHLPRRPRNPQWHCNITNVIGHTFCPFTTSVSHETFSTSHASVSYETSSKSHASRLQGERFVRDFLQKSRVKSPKRAFRTRLPPKSHTSAFRTRLPQKVTRQVSKTSVSYETSSKSHTSKSETSPKSQAETRVGAHTSWSPAKQFRDSSPSIIHIRSPANPNVTATLTSTTTHYLTIPCACHEMSPPSHLATSRFPAPAMKIPLPHLKTRAKPRKVTIPHHTFGMISTRSEIIHKNRHFS